MIRSATIVITMATKIVDAIENQRLAVRSIDMFGSASAIASLVTSVSRPSSGVIRTLTAKPALDAGVGGGEPGERVAADAEERRRGERDQDQVAGVGGDARQPADEDDDEREQLRAGRP